LCMFPFALETYGCLFGMFLSPLETYTSLSCMFPTAIETCRSEEYTSRGADVRRSCISYHYQGRLLAIATGFSIHNWKTFSTIKEEGYARLHSLLCMAFAIRSDSLFLSSHPHFLFTKPCPLTIQLQYYATEPQRS
jgi:hypothetical protein